MKMPCTFIYLFLFLASCKEHNEKNISEGKITGDNANVKKADGNFFPVTAYIKGQIFEIKNGGINPLKLVAINNHTDSGWLKMELLNEEFKDFLFPEIDTGNLITLFSETKFFDQTLNAVTLVYDPAKNLPDTFSLQHWDVYVDPNTSRVKRIYMIKKLPGKKIQQLTWLTGKSCNIVTIENINGNPLVEKEITIQWHF